MDARIRDRRRAVDRQRLRRRRRRTLSLLVVGALAVGVVAIARSPLFDVDGVAIDGATGEQAEEVRAAAGVRPGDNLLFVDLSAAAERVEELAWVRMAETQRRPPSTVRLEIAPRHPVAVVRLPDSAWLVDAAGVVVAGGERDELVEVDAPNSVLPGPGIRVTDAAVRNALAVQAGLPGSLRAAVEHYEAPSDRDLRLHLDNGVVVRFGLAERVDAKARTVALLLEQARGQADGEGDVTEGSVPAEMAGDVELDVRAPDNPVLIPADQRAAQP